eukprot:1204850-Pyramimonas_sp.AAC.1
MSARSQARRPCWIRRRVARRIGPEASGPSQIGDSKGRGLHRTGLATCTPENAPGGTLGARGDFAG